MDESFQIVLPMPDQANMQLPAPDLLNFYNDLNERTYWISGEIDETYLALVQYLIQWNREDKNKTERKPIKLIIASPGGVLEVAETIVSMIELSETPVIGIAVGTVASAASLIYLACHERYALKNSYFTLHKGSAQNIGGNYEEIQSFMEQYKVQVGKMLEFYKSHTNYEPEFIEEKMKGDWYINIDEAVEKGIVNKIVDKIGAFL